MPTKEFSLDDFPIVKASTISVPNSVTVYGPPGKGKSVFAASIVKVPNYERTLILDTEGGAVSVGNWHPEADVLPVTTADAFKKAFEAVVIGKLVERKSGKPYQAVIIDTLDKAQERQFDVFARDPSLRTNTGTEDKRAVFGALGVWTRKVVDSAHMHDSLFIFVVHSRDYENEKTGVTLNTVMLQGASRDNFPSVSDLVGYFDVVKVKEGAATVQKRTIDFRVDSKKVTKQRFADKLDRVVVDPDMPKIWELING